MEMISLKDFLIRNADCGLSEEELKQEYIEIEHDEGFLNNIFGKYKEDNRNGSRFCKAEYRQ